MMWIFFAAVLSAAIPNSYSLWRCHNLNVQCDNGALLHVDNIYQGCIYYHCNCLAGYTGATCSTDINECATSPCQNGGTCIDQINRYSCVCPSGVYGSNCEINHCASQPCQNGGTCTGLPTTYKCTCDPTHFGPDCDIDHCTSQPCQNGGTCTGSLDTYSCTCDRTHYGHDCEKALHWPTDSVCRSDGDHQCYSVFNRKLAWKDAEEYCVARRGHLAVPDNSDEELFLETHLNSIRVRYSDTLFWIGGTKSGANAVHWVTGSPSHVYRWPSGHLDVAPGTKCMSLDGSFSFMWQAFDCDRPSYFICEERALYSLIG